MHNNEGKPLPDCDSGYQLLVCARLVDLGEGLAGHCNIRLEGPDDATPIGEMDEDHRSAVVELLLITALLSLARQEVFGPVLRRVLTSLDLAVEPETDSYSFSSEDNNLEQTTQGQSE